MNDTWTVRIVDVVQRELGKFTLIPSPSQFRKWSVSIPNLCDYFLTTPSTYKLDGDATEALVYKNSWLYAVVKYFEPETVVWGQLEDRPIYVTSGQLTANVKCVDSPVCVSVPAALSLLAVCVQTGAIW
jgi:hypothetical protein